MSEKGYSACILCRTCRSCSTGPFKSVKGIIEHQMSIILLRHAGKRKKERRQAGDCQKDKGALLCAFRCWRVAGMAEASAVKGPAIAEGQEGQSKSWTTRKSKIGGTHPQKARAHLIANLIGARLTQRKATRAPRANICISTAGAVSQSGAECLNVQVSKCPKCPSPAVFTKSVCCVFLLDGQFHFGL